MIQEECLGLSVFWYFFYFRLNLKGQQNLVDTRWPMMTPPSLLLCSQCASLRWRPCVYLTQRPVINRVIMHKVTHLQRSTWGMDHWQNKPITSSLLHQPAVHFLPKFLRTLLKRPSERFSHTLWDFWGTDSESTKKKVSEEVVKDQRSTGTFRELTIIFHGQQKFKQWFSGQFLFCNGNRAYQIVSLIL